MVTIKGKKVSEETAHLALQEYFATHPEKYQFGAGDVAENSDGDTRIIVKVDGHLRSLCPSDCMVLSGVQDQKKFEYHKYKKIGEWNGKII